MKVFRLQRKKYKIELSGVGASKKGARWNFKGSQIIYTALNRSLAMAEILVNYNAATIPSDFVIIEINIPESIKYKTIKESDLPKKWSMLPYHMVTKKIGDEFINKNKNSCLKVPSAVVKGEYNMLINPNHIDFKKIKIKNYTDFTFDTRLF